MIFPASATADASRLIAARMLRGFADGFISIYLAAYLKLLGFSALQIGMLVTAMLIGSAVLTLMVGLAADRLSPRRVLFGAAMLMVFTGAGFAAVTEFWPLLIIAFIGTLNPSSADVSIFLPIEQSILAGESASRDRTALFGLYSFGGAFAGALGALISGVPETAARYFHWNTIHAFQAGFLLYASAAVGIFALYKSMHLKNTIVDSVRNAPLSRSRSIVLRLTALFALDSFGGGFVIDSLLSLWLFMRFGLSLQTAGAIFFAARILAALSQLASPRLAIRFGLIETMVFTHIPANLFLILAAMVSDARLAVLFLLLRSALSSMDVPARQSYVMAVTPVEERAAAASMTNVPRSLSSAISPFLAGALLERSAFGWPLMIGGALKIIYDLLLLMQFRTVRPNPSREERPTSAV